MAKEFLKVRSGVGLKPGGAPADPVDGDIYYDSTGNQFQFRQNGGWSALGGLANVVEDLTPQLGGALDTLNFNIRDSATDNSHLILNATTATLASTVGDAKVSGETETRIEVANGDMYFTAVNGGISMTTFGGLSLDGKAVLGISTTIKTTTYTAVSGDEIFADTTSAAFTITLPAAPDFGNRVKIIDYNGNWATNNVTVGRNGQNINGTAADFILNLNNAWAEFIYVDATQGWRVIT